MAMRLCTIVLRHRRLADALVPVKHAISQRGGMVMEVRRLSDDAAEAASALVTSVADDSHRDLIVGAIRQIPRIEIIRVDNVPTAAAAAPVPTGT